MPLQNPHNHHLDASLEPGAVVVVKGTATDDGEGRITVNLSQFANGYDAPNIVFQLNIRFDSDEVVMNSKDAGNWGSEQKKSGIKALFVPGGPIDIRILAKPEKFIIMAQHKEFATYEHRMPLNSVTDVFVAGAITIKGVACGGRPHSMPFDAHISNYGVGDMLYISGETSASAKSVAFNLYNQNGDSVLHFNPRFNDNEVVRNAKIGGEYGDEEKEGAFPFAKDTVFDVAIVNGSGRFTIYANDLEFCTFEHRARDNAVVRVGIEGDLDSLHTVDVLRG
jgi:hypothetical protein